MENEIEKNFLPIGTVVLLKKATKPLMIVGYATLPHGEVYDVNGKVENNNPKIYDYCGYFYPEGLIDSNRVFAFNHSQIEKICFKGYESEEFKELSQNMTKKIEELENKIIELKEKIQKGTTNA